MTQGSLYLESDVDAGHLAAVLEDDLGLGVVRPAPHEAGDDVRDVGDHDLEQGSIFYRTCGRKIAVFGKIAI